MSTLIPGSEPEPTTPIDYHAAEGLDAADPVDNPVVATDADGNVWREWMMVGVGLTALLAILAVMVSAFTLATDDDSTRTTRTAAPTAQPPKEPAAAGETAPPTLADAKGVAFEPFERVDPTLPP